MDDLDQIRKTISNLIGVMTPYDAGYDCGKNGPNMTNCHFGIFSTKEKMEEWQRGKKDAERSKPTSPAPKT